MSDIPPIKLVWEDPAWPDALRAPFTDASVPQRLIAAADFLSAKIASSAPGQLEFAALVGGKKLLTDWGIRGFPQRPSQGSVTALKSLLERYGLAGAADEIRKRFPFDPDGPLPQVITPPAPSDANSITWFTPPTAQLDLARGNLKSYDQWLVKQHPDLSPVVPSRNDRLTGLTRFMNGRLPALPTDLDPQQWQNTAEDWLFKPPATTGALPTPAACLLGLDDPAAAQKQFQRPDAVILPHSRIVAGGDTSAPKLATSVHVRFQQKYGAWPVYGGRVVVHMAEGDNRCSVSSSYLPIPAGSFADYQLRSEEEARAIGLRALAQHALNGQMDQAEALSLYVAVLGRWLAAGNTELTDEEREKLAPAIAGKLAEQLRSLDLAGPVAAALDQLPAALAGGASARLADARDALDKIRSQLAGKRIADWDEGRVVYFRPRSADDGGLADKCFVLPFAGKYYLAYRVEFLSQRHDRGWRVFVNADRSDTRCDVMGWPESLMAHALTAFFTSEEAANPTPSPGVPHVFNLQAGDLGFMDLRWHKEAVAGAPALPLAEIAQPPPGRALELIQDAANIAYNASEFYKYFLELCDNQPFSALLEDQTHVPPFYFTVTVGARAAPRDPLSTGFLASTAAPEIVFQDAPLLRVGSQVIGRPARDPELVFHEIAHGLMWRMNSEPFDLGSGVTPFARALVEGYANYFARACAVHRAGDGADAAWARACYNAFGDRYNPFHDSGLDLAGNKLALPNLYPPPPGQDPHANDPLTIVEFQKYSIGMVWARALWKIREQFAADGKDVLLADRLAFNAYLHMPGWLASFETAAEGILDGVDHTLAAQLADWFGARNILAGRGVQALALAGAEALAGTDAGVTRRPAAAGAATAWGAWETFPPGEGVTALAHDAAPGGKTFAATERDVYAWDAAASAWTPHGTWKAKLSQQIPLCLAVSGGVVYAGTARGLYALAPGGDWAPWKGASRDLNALVRDIATIQRIGASGVAETVVYVATLAEPLVRRLKANATPENVQWEDASSVKVGNTTAVAIEGGQVYLGTLREGIWRQETLLDADSWRQIAPPDKLGDGAVLALRVQPVNGVIEVLAGATTGLFQGREGSNVTDPWVWREVPFNNDQQADETITAVLYLSDTVWLVGTANRALWRVAPGAGGQRVWTQYGDIGL